MNEYVQNPLTTSYSAQKALATQNNVDSIALKNEKLKENSGKAFKPFFEEEHLSQEFEGELTNVVTQLSNLQSSLVNEDVITNTSELLKLFDKKLPDISQLHAFQYIQDPNEKTKSQLNHGLIDLNERIGSLNEKEKRVALNQLRNLEAHIQNQSMRFQLDQYNTGMNSSQSQLGQLSAIGSNTLSKSQMQFMLENQINEMVYKPLMNIDSGTSDENTNEQSNNNQGFASVIQPSQNTINNNPG